MVAFFNAKRRVSIYVIALVSALCTCTTVKAEEPFIYTKASISERHRQYNEVMSKYGEIWIGYTIAKEMVITDSSEKRFAIDKAEYYYMKDGTLFLMGSVNKTGIFNKNGICLKETPGNVASGFKIVGISSLLIERSSLAFYLILQSINNNDVYRETESYALIDFDIQHDTIMLRDMSIFR